MRTAIAHPVRPLITTDAGIVPGAMLSARAHSPSAAMRACRAAGFRILRSGGLVELGEEVHGPWGEDVPVWYVTVHP